MKSKLTLSLPERTILEAKKIASERHMSVSSLFSESLEFFRQQDRDTSVACTGTGIDELVGVLHPQEPYDARSAHIRKKHG